MPEESAELLYAIFALISKLIDWVDARKPMAVYADCFIPSFALSSANQGTKPEFTQFLKVALLSSAIIAQLAWWQRTVGMGSEDVKIDEARSLEAGVRLH